MPAPLSANAVLAEESNKMPAKPYKKGCRLLPSRRHTGSTNDNISVTTHSAASTTTSWIEQNKICPLETDIKTDKNLLNEQTIKSEPCSYMPQMQPPSNEKIRGCKDCEWRLENCTLNSMQIFLISLYSFFPLANVPVMCIHTKVETFLCVKDDVKKIH